MSVNVLQPGPTIIYTSTAGSTTVNGAWWKVHPSVGEITAQVVQTGSSVGSTASSTTFIEVSNDGITPLATKALTVALTGTTDVVSDGAAFASSMQGSWQWVRAKLNTLTTSTAGSAGSPVVVVTLNAAGRGIF